MNIKKVIQKPSFCGPAILEMMYSYYELTIDQETIAKVAGTVVHIGTRLDQLAQAVKTLSPNLRLYAKYNSKLDDLHYLESIGLPVAVEWQGVFLRNDGTCFDEGHFSIVNRFDKTANNMSLIDPDPHSGLINGEIALSDFCNRWWDDNRVFLTNKRRFQLQFINTRLAFVLERKNKRIKSFREASMFLTLSTAKKIWLSNSN